MLIKTYEQMSNIVENCRKLEWDGWDVVAYVQDDTGFFEMDGVFKEEKWYVRKTYKLEKDGWDIPDRVIKKCH
jgi:hypothetical protein